MKKIIISLCYSLIFLVSSTAQDYVSGEVLVRFEKDTKISTFLKNINQQDILMGELSLKEAVIADWDIYLLNFDVTQNEAYAVQELLREQENVRTAELNFIARERTTPNDGSYEQQWNLDKIEVEKVWEVTTGGTTVDDREIVVMVLDSGFDIEHGELDGNLWENSAEIPGDGIDNDMNGFGDDIHGWNFTADSPEYSASSHGMGVTGVVGAKGNNGTGIAGINWNIKMMLFQGPTYNQILQSYYYAYQQRKLYNETEGEEGAFVVSSNASLGFSDPCEDRFLWNDMLDSTGTVGILNVGATVNANLDVDAIGDTPTGCPSDFVVSVTNTDITDNKVISAGYGTESIDIGAPGGKAGGTRIYTLAPNQSYNNDFGGCSAASPHVAGVVALMYALPCDAITQSALSDPAQTAKLMKRSIIEGAEPNESLVDITVSEGRLNAYRSMLWWKVYCEEPSEERIDIEDYIDTYISETGFINVQYDPSIESVTVDYSINELREFEVVVFDVLGRELIRGKETADAFSPQSFSFGTGNLADGIYFISILEGKNPIATKFVVTR